MGIFKKNMAKKAVADSPEAKSLPVAMGIKARNKKKLGSGAISEFNTNAQEMNKFSSAAEAIMAKRKAKAMAEGGMVDDDQPDLEEDAMEGPADLDELNEDAAMKELYDDSQLSDQPEDSNLMGDDDLEMDKHDMIDAIRRKIKSKRAME